MSAPSNPDGVFAQKIAAVLTIPYNDNSVKHALTVLDATNFSDVTDRTLLDSVETSIIDQVGRILDDFEPMYDGITQMSTHISAFDRNFTQINASIEKVRASFGPILKEAKMLEAEKIYVQNKLNTAKAFVDSFVVTEHETQILTNSSLPIDDEFYRVFEKAKSIECNCSELLAESPSLGEQLLTSMTKLMAGAVEKLKYQVEKSLRETEDLRSSSNSLKRDLSLLSQEPFAFKTVLNQICDTRKAAVKKELQATAPLYDHEPERVVGVECAWLHSVMINEYDLFRSLIGGKDSDDFAFTLYSADNSEDLIYELIDSILQAIEPLFKQRLNKLISTQHKIIALDSIHNVIEFYKKVFDEHKQKSIGACFSSISDSLTSQFNHLLLVEIDQAKKTKKIAPNLATPEFIFSILRLIRKLFANYEQSMNYQPLGDEYIRGRINDMLDPFIKQCYILSEQLEPYEKNIFLINCMDPIKMELVGNVFANFKIDDIDGRIESHSHNLANLETAYLVQESGIGEFADDKPKLYARVDEFLLGGGLATARRLERVKSPSIIASITKDVHEKFIEKYKQVIDDDAPKSIDDIRVLLA